MAHILTGHVSNACSWHKITHPMLPDQLTVYNLLKRRYRGIVIAGGFAAHNLAWKTYHSDVDFFIAKYIDKDMVEEGYTLKDDIEAVSTTSLAWMTEVQNESLMHRSKKRPLVRVTNAGLGIDVVFTLIPKPPAHFNDYQILEWNAFYVLCGFDIVLSRVALLDVDKEGLGLFLTIGTRADGIREIDVRLFVAQRTREFLDGFLNGKEDRLRKIDASRYKQLRDVMSLKIRRLQKYSGVYLKEQVVPDKMCDKALYSIAYYLNPDSKYTLPACVRYFEEEALKKPIVYNKLRSWTNATVSSAMEAYVRSYKFPYLTKSTECKRCKFPRQFMIDY